MKKRVLAMVMALCLALSLLPVTAGAVEDEGAEPTENYVEIRATYNQAWIANGRDSSGRKTLADEILNKHYETLKAASDAVTGLYSQTGGSYNLGSDFPNAGPFYYRHSDSPSDAENSPLTALEYIIHGEVPFGSESWISLGESAQGFHISDVKLTGADDNAKISGNVSISASVAGGYVDMFVERGTFTISNIEFTSTTGNTSLSANGNSYHKDQGNNNRAEETLLVIENCTFHNQLYSYVYDPDSQNQVKRIMNNEFIAGSDIDEGTYAFVLQGEGTACTFEGNTITGYKRGINIQFQSTADTGVVSITNNVITVSHATRPAIQLTTAKEATVTGNTLTNEIGPAIWFYNNGAGTAYQAEQTTITGNTINAKDLFQNGNSGDATVTFDGDHKLIFSGNSLSENIDPYTLDRGIFSPITVTFAGSGTGTLDPAPLNDGTIPVVNGESQTITIQPAAGSYISDVSVNGVSQGAVNTVTFTNVTSEQTLSITLGRNSTGDSGPTTYSPTLDVSDGGSIKVSPRTPEAGDTVTITPDPDSGYEVDEVLVTDRDGDEIRVTANRDGTYTFTQPRGRVTIEVTFVRETGETTFSDVPETYWAYDEIEWAYDNGYVNGTSASTFAPGASISRQQVWMILARLSGGSPADMAAAREWAMANDISDGTNPGNAVTRQQLAALLFRFAQANGYDSGDRAALTGFPDAGSVASYAVEALQWATASGILNGTSQGTLNPAGTATRAQFAVMLYRFWNGL